MNKKIDVRTNELETKGWGKASFALFVFGTLVLAALLVGGVVGASPPHAQTGVVITPWGKVPKANIQIVPNHSTIVGNSFVVLPNGVKSALPGGASIPGVNHPSVSGWAAYAYYHYTGSLFYPAGYGNYFANEYIPSPPSSNDGQIIYFFLGLEPEGQSAILQPVLQWGYNGMFGGNYWCIADWYVYNNNANYIVSQPLTSGVSTGAEFGNDMYGQSFHNGGYGEWTAYAINENYPFQEVSLSYTGQGNGVLDSVKFTWGYATLEVYNVDTSSELPSGGSFNFLDIQASNQHGTAINPSWGTYAQQNTGIPFAVGVPSSSEITIYW